MGHILGHASFQGCRALVKVTYFSVHVQMRGPEETWACARCTFLRGQSQENQDSACVFSTLEHVSNRAHKGGYAGYVLAPATQSEGSCLVTVKPFHGSSRARARSIEDELGFRSCAQVWVCGTWACV